MNRLPPQLLISAYMQGIFPMGHADGSIYWYDPDPRAIIPLDTFHTPRSLQRTIRKGVFEIRVDSDFRGVMRACSERDTTWITDEFIDAYERLHLLDLAHTVEAWQEGQLVGGLYGVAIRGLFAGESMFSRVKDASKVALVHLIERLKAGGYTLLDTQFVTPHLARFGATEISREEYKTRLAQALNVEATFFPEGF